jgi:hypothetical protein
MSLKSRSDGLDQKLILMPQQKTSFCAINTKITTYLFSHPSIFAFLDVLISFQTYTYSKIQFANRGMQKLRNDVRNKK